jgi:hypothetical protein
MPMDAHQLNTGLSKLGDRSFPGRPSYSSSSSTEAAVAAVA